MNSLKSCLSWKALQASVACLCSSVIIMCVLLVQMAPVWLNAPRATMRMRRDRSVSRATFPVSPASGSTATSASPVKATYFERAKSAWRPASTGSLTRSPLIHHINCGHTVLSSIKDWPGLIMSPRTLNQCFPVVSWTRVQFEDIS